MSFLLRRAIQQSLSGGGAPSALHLLSGTSYITDLTQVNTALFSTGDYVEFEFRTLSPFTTQEFTIIAGTGISRVYMPVSLSNNIRVTFQTGQTSTIIMPYDVRDGEWHTLRIESTSNANYSIFIDGVNRGNWGIQLSLQLLSNASSVAGLSFRNYKYEAGATLIDDIPIDDGAGSSLVNNGSGSDATIAGVEGVGFTWQ